LPRPIAPSPKGRCLEDATTAACPDRQDHQADQAKMVDQADQELQDHQASLANHHQKSALPLPFHHANHAHQANPANPDPKVLPATPAQLVTQVTPAKMVTQAAQAHKVPLVHPEIQVAMDHEVIQARQLSALQQLPETQDPPDPMDHQAQLVNQARKETTETQVPQDPKAHQVQLADPAKMVLQATKAHLAPMVPKANRVYARNIAPWTAVSSSKMEQDVKKKCHFLCSFLQSRRKNGFGERLFLFAINPYLLFFAIFYFKQHSQIQESPTIVFQFRF